MAMLPLTLLYMFNIQPSMTKPMVPPMVMAMKTRLWLKRTWLSSHDPVNITKYMSTIDVRIMAPNRR